jgi:DNA helicase-2/ATP-dependent DNA helicase PcrA
LEQLEQLTTSYPTRESFLSDLTLDPPDALGDEAGAPYLDEDYLVLSTIHSAKGQEWDVVFVLNVVDGCIPSDMATGTAEEIEEERRLLYVAMTRARDCLHLLHPHRFYTRRLVDGDNHVYAPRTRFLPEPLLSLFERSAHGTPAATELVDSSRGATIDVPARLRDMWR